MFENFPYIRWLPLCPQERASDNMKSLISCTAWVTRGVAAKDPVHYEVNEGTLERISKLAGINIEEARAELERANAAEDEFDGIEREEEEDEEGEGGKTYVVQHPEPVNG